MRGVLGVVLALLLVPAPAGTGAAPCVVQEGVGVGGVRIGSPIARALADAGRPVAQVIRGTETVYQFAGAIYRLTAVRGVVQRVATRQAGCATARGVAIGDPEQRAVAAYPRTVGWVRARAVEGERLIFPFEGVEFLVVAGRVRQIEVFSRTAAPPSAAAPPATPAPGAAGAEAEVTVVELTGRTEGNTFVVSGRVRNAGAPQALFVEITLLGPGDRPVATGSVPVVPNPIGLGRTGAFEERLTLDQVVQKVRVVVRSMNRPARALAEAVTEIRDVRQFAAVVERQLEVTIPPNPEGRPGGTVAVVTNRSALRVTGLTIALELQGTCVIWSQPPPPPPPAPLPTPQRTTFTDARRGTISIPALDPGASVEVPIALEGPPGACMGPGTQWSVTWRVTGMAVEAPQ
ncbi:MAG: hypothetical protein QN158_01630 [Armatimonadota bacterium]|nr:hypothetical protein [Armatimonadota bacterium]MDR7458689.1 hypothetical protein [Armatimonadota bacterium]MDR7479298.1 hypothetical protein [Armatimonadota bacterium]MDR7487896.1 hypothetical protein [Armatimonadota bacterium]MDR7501031.1 hypothetical protein [Armatimonadota bacterium]